MTKFVSSDFFSNCSKDYTQLKQDYRNRLIPGTCKSSDGCENSAPDQGEGAEDSDQGEQGTEEMEAEGQKV